MTTPTFRQAVLCIATTLAAPPLLAHGLIQDPPSRNWFCGAITKPDHITNGTAKYPECKTAFDTNWTGSYNFMSVLTHTKGRSEVTPLPANVCGFNAETFGNGATPWDTPMQWPVNKVSAGRKEFTWNISWGPHYSDTADFHYYITKPGFEWSPTRALTWADFEEQPFCTLNYDDTKPDGNPDVVPDKGATLFHTFCQLPARNGRHVENTGTRSAICAVYSVANKRRIIRDSGARAANLSQCRFSPSTSGRRPYRSPCATIRRPRELRSRPEARASCARRP